MKKENSYVTVSILDNGAGIPDEAMLKIREHFLLRKDKEALESDWTFANGIIEGHYGTISCISSVGEGTVFSFTLPLDQEGNNTWKGPEN